MIRIKTTLLILLCMLTVTALCSCKKGNSRLTGIEHYKYVGMAQGHYKYYNLDHETGEFTHIVWDSTYETFVDVTINYDLRKIKFSTQRFYYNSGVFGLYEQEFNYEESKSEYVDYFASHCAAGFRFGSGDSLVHYYTYFMGAAGPPTTTETLNLNAKRVN